jgi:hypothetical protein
MLEIINHTPSWVFALFIGLVVLGVRQAKTQTMTLLRLAALPLAMLALSFYGVWSTFEGASLGIICWVGSVAVAALSAQRFDFNRGVRFLVESRSFILPGTWLPLVLMMAIFFTKYGVGISLAQHAELRFDPSFIAAASLAYGTWSGVFFGRMAQIFAAHRHQMWMGQTT